MVETTVSIAKIEADEIVNWSYKLGSVVRLAEAQEEIALICEMIDNEMAAKARLLMITIY